MVVNFDAMSIDTLYGGIRDLIEQRLSELEEHQTHLRTILATIKAAPSLTPVGSPVKKLAALSTKKGGSSSLPTPTKRSMSVEARKRLSRQMKKRWKERKAAGNVSLS